MAEATGTPAVHSQGVASGRVTSQQVGEATRADSVDDPTDCRRTRRDAHREGGHGPGAEPDQGVLRSVSRPLSDRRKGPGSPHMTAEQAISSTLTNG